MIIEKYILQSDGGILVPHARWSITKHDTNKENKMDLTVHFSNGKSSMVIVNCDSLNEVDKDSQNFSFEKQSILFTGVDKDLYVDDFRDYFDQLGIYEVSHADENGQVDEFQWTFGF